MSLHNRSKKSSSDRVDMPGKHPHYQYEKLNAPEKITIQVVYLKKWRRFVKQAKLSKEQEAYFKLYFKEIHTRYYHKVVKGGSYVTAYRLIKNFLLSKANENIRAVLQSQNPFNLTIFIQGLRSQIELNALIGKFVKDENYLKKFILMNDDRKKVEEVETVTNINTLVKNLDSTYLPYQDHYNALSLLLHPNPTGVKFYAQAEGESTSDGSGVFSLKLKFHFDETVTKTETSNNWFNNYTWTFLTYIEHFLMLFDQLKSDQFFVTEDEKHQYIEFAMMEAFNSNKIYFLKIINQASRDNQDIGQAVRKGFDDLLAQRNDN